MRQRKENFKKEERMGKTGLSTFGKDKMPEKSNDKKPIRKYEKSPQKHFDGKTKKQIPDLIAQNKKKYHVGNDYNKKPEREENASKPKKYVKKEKKQNESLIRLNRYIANAGICSRREADKLIESGAVSVNGKIVTELGIKVTPDDVISYGGETLRKEKPVYLLLNKPKDYITSVDDPQGRRTVMSLIANACRERVYPVGRLDRSTTGLLLFTNDGDITKKLLHPKFGIKKIYHVELDKPLSRNDMVRISEGIELEDGLVKVDAISYDAGGDDKKSIGIEIHSGKNRIVRRIFESLHYEVRKLDRVYFAGLTKKDLPRGRWRFLTDMEINMLKMLK